MFSAKEIFDIAIKLEDNGERFYRKALDLVSDQGLQDALRWLADQEVDHRNRFLKMKNSLKPEADDLWAERMNAAILEGAVSHHALSLDEVDMKTIGDESELMQAAIEFELDGVAFYEIIRSFVTDPETIKHIDEIIEEERRHVLFIRERQKIMELQS